MQTQLIYDLFSGSCRKQGCTLRLIWYLLSCKVLFLSSIFLISLHTICTPYYQISESHTQICYYISMGQSFSASSDEVGFLRIPFNKQTQIF